MEVTELRIKSGPLNPLLGTGVPLWRTAITLGRDWDPLAGTGIPWWGLTHVLA